MMLRHPRQSFQRRSWSRMHHNGFAMHLQPVGAIGDAGILDRSPRGDHDPDQGGAGRSYSSDQLFAAVHTELTLLSSPPGVLLFTTPLACDLCIHHLAAGRAETHGSIRTPVVHVGASNSCPSQLFSLNSGFARDARHSRRLGSRCLLAGLRIPEASTKVSALRSTSERPPSQTAAPDRDLGPNPRGKSLQDSGMLAKTTGGADGIRTRDLRRDRPAF